MTRAEPRCRDRVCRNDGDRPTTRYTAMRRDGAGRLGLCRALCPTSDQSAYLRWTSPALHPGLDMLCVVDCLGIFSPLSFDEDYLRGLRHPWCCYRISAVGGCHSRTLSLFPSLLDSLELRLVFIYFLHRYPPPPTAQRSDLAAMRKEASAVWARSADDVTV
jgi:hypothetical protein